MYIICKNSNKCYNGVYLLFRVTYGIIIHIWVALAAGKYTRAAGYRSKNTIIPSFNFSYARTIVTNFL